jgi:glutaredoxin
MRTVQLYSRVGCHLCELALSTLVSLQQELTFQIEEIDINSDLALLEKYGEQVPVIHIDGKAHDFFRVDPERFRKAFIAAGASITNR